MVWHGPDDADMRAAQLQVARTRIAVLEDAIRVHRWMVRDGWVSPHSPDRDANQFLWNTIEDDGGPR